MSAVITSRTWDLTPIFPSVESKEFQAAVESCKKNLAKLEADLNGSPAEFTQRFSGILESVNNLGEELGLVRAYLYMVTTTDTRHAAGKKAQSEFTFVVQDFQKAMKTLCAAIGNANPDDLINQTPYTKDHEFHIRQMHTLASRQMSPAEEALASDLAASGEIAWGRLHSTGSSQLKVTVELPTGPEVMSMSKARTLAYDPDREVRKAGYEAELRAWKESEEVFAATLNGIKGASVVVCAKRGWKSPLEEALFSENLDEVTLESMMTAAKESFPTLRRYFKAKARYLGTKQLAFFDIFAPVGSESRTWDYEDGEKIVEKSFDSYSKKMGDLARMSRNERWVDVDPRDGKVDGAYCIEAGGPKSRILLNFKPAFGSVSVHAHELGHAYHNLCLDGRTYLQKQETPSSLAETASIFCETILQADALNELSGDDQLPIIEASLQRAGQVVVDITSRFLFEKTVMERRVKSELSPSELCEIMLWAQDETYGDGLDPELRHPYMWAAKPHYYRPGNNFYNFPYMFGMLFALGLYRVYKEEGNSFLPRYDKLLSSTGMQNASTLAKEFGIEIRTPEFWRGSLAVITEDVERFEKLVP
ncbi:MAG: M3 family oligoendopeptidase [Armatimonadetes bacterium]|nr:M3 family oligoendopeptidase [Armatimonadota bacterium]